MLPPPVAGGVSSASAIGTAVTRRKISERSRHVSLRISIPFVLLRPDAVGAKSVVARRQRCVRVPAAGRIHRTLLDAYGDKGSLDLAKVKGELELRDRRKSCAGDSADYEGVVKK
jgi:hypothetical protein